MSQNDRHTCPCCGYKVHDEPVGSLEICPICFWQDDEVDLEEMYQPMGPNKVSLEQAQKNYIGFGASEKRLRDDVRKPNEDDVKDDSWRPLDREVDKPRETPAYDNNPEEVYYWLWTN